MKINFIYLIIGVLIGYVTAIDKDVREPRDIILFFITLVFITSSLLLVYEMIEIYRAKGYAKRTIEKANKQAIMTMEIANEESVMLRAKLNFEKTKCIQHNKELEELKAKLKKQLQQYKENEAKRIEYYEDIRRKHNEKILNLEAKNKELVDRLNKKYGKHLSNLKDTNTGRYRMETRKLNKVVTSLKASE